MSINIVFCHERNARVNTTSIAFKRTCEQCRIGTVFYVSLNLLATAIYDFHHYITKHVRLFAMCFRYDILIEFLFTYLLQQSAFTRL